MPRPGSPAVVPKAPFLEIARRIHAATAPDAPVLPEPVDHEALPLLERLRCRRAAALEGGVHVAPSRFLRRCLDLVTLPRRLTLPDVLPLVEHYAFAPGNLAGGSLHCLLADSNPSDCEWEMDWALAHVDKDGVALAGVLARLSRTQQKKLSALFNDLVYQRSRPLPSFAPPPRPAHWFPGEPLLLQWPETADGAAEVTLELGGRTVATWVVVGADSLLDHVRLFHARIREDLDDGRRSQP